MVIPSALYYPFTGPKTKTFVKTALFLWDSVDFIVPYPEFSHYGYDRDVMEALEIFGRMYVPTDEDKRKTHDALLDFCTGRTSTSLLFPVEKPESAYHFYPEKLFPETWDMLKETGFAKIDKKSGLPSRPATKALFGYYMMSALAANCNYGDKRLITDENDPYHSLAALMSDSLPHQEVGDDWYGRLMSITVSGPDFSEIDVAALLRVRKKEDVMLRSLRQSFAMALEAAVESIKSNAGNPNAVRDISRNFTDSMERDFGDLKRALRRSAKSLLFSKEAGVSVLAAVAFNLAGGVDQNPQGLAFGTTAVASLAVLGGLQSGLMSYQDRRRKILSEHPSAWLLAGRDHFQLY